MSKLKEKLQRILIDRDSRDVLGAVAALFSVNFLASIVGAVVSIVQARFVTAEELGFFKQFTIISNYVFFLHFGTFHAIERLYPMHMGKGETDKARRYVQVASAWILFVCGALSVVYLILGTYRFIYGDWKSGFCWLVQIVAAWSTMYGGFLAATYRSGKEFQTMAKANVWNPLLQVLVVPIYYVQPFMAMVARNCTSIVSTVRLFISRPVKEKPRFSVREFLFLVKEGMPLYTAAYITTTGLDAIRGTLVLLVLSTEDWGYWSFAYTIILLVLQLPTSINAVYQPRIISEYGKSGSVKKSMKLAKQPIVYGSAIMMAVIPLGILSIKYIMPLILPNYVGATSLLIVLLCAVPFKLSDVFTSILNAMHKVIPLNIISLVCTGIQVITSLLFAYLGVGIVSFGIGFAFGYIFRTIMLVAYVMNSMKKEKFNE